MDPCRYCDTPIDLGTHDCCPQAELDYAKAALLNIRKLTEPDHVQAADGYVDHALIHALASRGLNGSDPEPELPLYASGGSLDLDAEDKRWVGYMRDVRLHRGPG